MTDLLTLREANRSRNAEWGGSDKISLAFRGLEHEGEGGELIENVMQLGYLALALSTAQGKVSNATKKMSRVLDGIVAPKTDMSPAQQHSHLMREIGREAADVLITLDLLCMSLGIDLAEATQDNFNVTSQRVGLKTKLDLASCPRRP